MAKTLNGVECEFGFHTDSAPDEVKSNQVWLAIYEMAVGHEVTAYDRELQARRALAKGVVMHDSSEFEEMRASYQKSMRRTSRLRTGRIDHWTRCHIGWMPDERPDRRSRQGSLRSHCQRHNEE